MKSKNKYQDNDQKYNQIKNQYKSLSNLTFYRIHLSIAVDEWVKYLNSIDKKLTKYLISESGETFAILKNGIFVKNERFYTKCLNKAKKNKFLMFGFFTVNIVLDKLDEKLKSIV